MSEKLYLPKINFTPTMRCNLRCALCGVMVPHYSYRPHMDVDEFAQTISRVFEIVDEVGKLQITGGEPFLHKDLFRILEICFAYPDKFSELWLFTNGTSVMTQDIKDILIKHRDKVVIHISQYDEEHESAKKNVELREENGIKFKYLKYYGDSQYCDGWVDQGDFVAHYRSEAKLEDVFSKCINIQTGGSWYVRGGQMHWCGRSIRGAELGKIPLREEDYLDIFDDSSIEKKKEKLRKLLKTKYILACDYCNGCFVKGNTKRHPAGEQLPPKSKMGKV